MKNAVANVFLILISVFVCLLIAEGVAQVYVYKIAKKGKLFQPDIVSGWKVKPNLNLQRKNADGDPWLISTDDKGYRIIPNNDTRSSQIALILGDSFAFGEGVDVNDRFDAQIYNHGFNVLNTGVMGWGTDQQYINAKQYLDILDHDDVMIVITYYNDFYDITRKKFSGRAKPWFSIDHNQLIEHPPQITYLEMLRDKSYIASVLSRLFENHSTITDSDIESAMHIYQLVITDLANRVKSKEARFILAYHGLSIPKDSKHKELIFQALKNVCGVSSIECLDIDRHIDVSERQYFLIDGHWNNLGHNAVGTLMVDRIIETARH